MDLKEELMSDTIDDVIGEADEDEERLLKLVYGHPTDQETCLCSLYPFPNCVSAILESHVNRICKNKFSSW